MSNLFPPEDEGNVRNVSRRKFLIGTGGVLGAAALVGAGGLSRGEILGARIAAAAGLNSDMDILMFALTLEHIEDAAYRSVNASGLLSGQVADIFRTFGEHEHAHVVALTDTITKLGGTPVAEQASYNFPNLTSQDEVVKFFTAVEDLGAGAYLGAAPLIKDKGLLAAAASIHDVEGEHAATLHAIMGDAEPSPAFAAPLTYDQVLQVVGPILAGGAAGGGATPGMPGTGAPQSFSPWLVAAGLGAAAVGGLLKVRGREQRAEENTEA